MVALTSPVVVAAISFEFRKQLSLCSIIRGPPLTSSCLLVTNAPCPRHSEGVLLVSTGIWEARHIVCLRLLCICLIISSRNRLVRRSEDFTSEDGGSQGLCVCEVM